MDSLLSRLLRRPSHRSVPPPISPHPQPMPTMGNPSVSAIAVKEQDIVPEVLPTPCKPSTEHDTICTICTHPTSLPRPDNTIETLHILPCTHTFGSICIYRWLTTSASSDCPICRRPMIHKGCGHLILPAPIQQAPAPVNESEIERICVRCKGNDDVAGYLAMEGRRVELGVEVLRGLAGAGGLLGFGGGMGGKGQYEREIEGRIGELRMEYAGLCDRVWRAFEESGRTRW